MIKWVGYSSVDDSKKSNKLYDIELIKQDILNQFMCRKGSRLRMSNWGSIIWNKLFDGYDSSMNDEIIADCQRIVESDTRLSLLSTNIQKVDHGLIIELKIMYTPDNLNFDMYVTYNNNLLEN